MDLKDLMLIKRSHTKKNASCIISFNEIEEQVKVIYGFRCQHSGYLWGRGVNWVEALKEASGVLKMFFILTWGVVT